MVTEHVDKSLEPLVQVPSRNKQVTHGMVTRLRLIWADSASTGLLAAWRYGLRRRPRVRLQIIKRSDQAKGFVLSPKRGVV